MHETWFGECSQRGDADGVRVWDQYFRRGGELAFTDRHTGGDEAIDGGALVFEGERKMAGVETQAEVLTDRGAARTFITIQHCRSCGDASACECSTPMTNGSPSGIHLIHF